MNKEKAIEILGFFRPHLDQVTFDYSVSIIKGHSGVEDETLSSLLLPLMFAFDCDQEKAKFALSQIEDLLNSDLKPNEDASDRLIPLEVPIQMQDLISVTHSKLVVDTEFTTTGTRAKSLEIAKSKKKRKTVSFKCEPYVPQYSLDNLESFDSRGKARDVKVESFDISIPGRRILVNSSISLAYGRKNGLVGRNGIGKSTLLRHLSARELSVPKHISILHVEQEMLKDETTAIQSVLRAHSLREFLLKEEQ